MAQVQQTGKGSRKAAKVGKSRSAGAAESHASPDRSEGRSADGHATHLDRDTSSDRSEARSAGGHSTHLDPDTSSDRSEARSAGGHATHLDPDASSDRSEARSAGGHATHLDPDTSSDRSEARFAGGHANDLELRRRLISEAAYGLYAERGYAHGHDVDDWLQAEAAVDRLLESKSPPAS